MSGPLEAAADQRYVATVTQTAVNPAEAAYWALVAELAANVPDEGYYDVKQLRPLSNTERAVILLANPDVLNDFEFEPDQLAEVITGTADPHTWVVACTDKPLREWLFDDICGEVERDHEIVRQDAMDPYLRRG